MKLFSNKHIRKLEERLEDLENRLSEVEEILAEGDLKPKAHIHFVE